MSFIFPYILIAIILGIIPFILHFVHKGKKKQIPLSALFLFQKEMMESNKSIKFLSSFINILRALLIIIIITLIAKPLTDKEFWIWENEQNQEKVNLILIDNTLSMGYININQTHFEEALTFLKKLIEEFPYQNSLALEALGSKITYPVKLYKHKDQLLRQFPIIRLEKSNQSLNEKIAQIIEDLDSRKISISGIFILSDFQKTEWRDVTIPEELQLTLVKIGENYPPNSMIKKISIKDKLYFANDEAKADITVKQFAKGNYKRKLSLYLDNEFIREEQFELIDDQEKTISLFFGLNKDKWVFGDVRILYDRYTEDDTIAFPIYFKRNANILFLSHKDFPLAEKSIQYSIISTDQLKHTHKWDYAIQKDPEEYDFIICNRISSLTGYELRTLKKHIQNNKGIVFILNQKDSIYKIKNAFKKMGVYKFIQIKERKYFKNDLLLKYNNNYKNLHFSKTFQKFKNKIEVKKLYRIDYNKNDMIPLLNLGSFPLVLTSLNDKVNLHIISAGVNQDNSNILFQQWFPVLMKALFEEGIKKKLRETNKIEIEENEDRLIESNLKSYSQDELKKKFNRKYFMVSSSVNEWLEMSKQSAKKSTLQRNTLLEKIALFIIVLIIFIEFLLTYNIHQKKN